MDTLPVSLLNNRAVRTSGFAACLSLSFGFHLMAAVLLVIFSGYSGCQRYAFYDDVIQVDLATLPGPGIPTTSATRSPLARAVPTVRPPEAASSLSLKDPVITDSTPPVPEKAIPHPPDESDYIPDLEPVGPAGRLSDKAVASTALGFSGTDSVFDAANLDAPLMALSQKAPDYPVNAFRRDIEGWVKVSFLVNRQGRVEDVIIVEASPESIFDDTVRRCVARWRFKPGTVAGRPVVTRKTTVVRFELNKPS
ncbi:MAG: energy transducer TonB [Thermodesulfobacteriota bacterium]